jgi:hypothetical protein
MSGIVEGGKTACSALISKIWFNLDRLTFGIVPPDLHWAP